MGLPDFGGWVEGISKDIVEFGKHPANKALDLVTGYDLNERSRVRDEQAAGNAERDEIYLQQAGLYGRFSGRFDDPALGSPEAFEAMSHEDIKAAVDGMNGGSLRASAEGWTKIGESLQQALNDFRDFITTETDGKWEGVAKDSATAATGRYATESGNSPKPAPSSAPRSPKRPPASTKSRPPCHRSPNAPSSRLRSTQDCPPPASSNA
ncbi:hypothetical protein GS539_18785 [Rhodococcus hoagii]|nr:hypothetical protein [Prescottella equi]